MTTVAEIAAWMEAIAPVRLAEEWDNVGLLMGDTSSTLDRVMTCLTVTPTTATEAIEAGAGAIVSHHPILFRPVQTLRGDDPQGAMLLALARAGVAVLSHHTAFDNAEGGMNDLLAGMLGLIDVKPLRPSPPSPSFKLTIFTPIEAREPILAAAFGAGAGRIGAYSECSFSGSGLGTFFGGEGTKPTIGEAGRRESVDESRVEIVCPERLLSAVLAAIRSRHPYEEPAIDVIPLRPTPDGPGIGRSGRLPGPMALADLARMVADRLQAPSTQFVGDPRRLIHRVGIACGAGDSFLGDAGRSADVLLTGEARFHRGLEAESKGIGLIIAGHHATERPGVEDLADRLAQAFPTITSWASRRETDPFRACSEI